MKSFVDEYIFVDEIFLLTKIIYLIYLKWQKIFGPVDENMFVQLFSRWQYSRRQNNSVGKNDMFMDW